MDDDWLSTIPLLLMLLCAFYFAAAETAFSSVSRVRLRASADRGDKRAVRATFVLDNFDKAVTTLLIGTNIMHIVIASLVTIFASRKWGMESVAIATAATTVVVFFLGEMLPKSIAKKYSERISLALASSVYLLMKVFSPASYVLSAIGTGASKLTRGDSDVTVTEDELYDIIESIKDEGAIGTERGELIHSALLFADVTVENVLTSRVDLDAIDANGSCAEILEYIRSSKHSRLPVYENSIDNIIGILQIRRFLREYLKQGDQLQFHTLLDKPYFVHSSANIDELLPEMSRLGLNIAVVTDSYGGTLGIVTIEDMLEELVGDIWDEDDIVIERFERNENGSFRLDASLSVLEAFGLLGLEPKQDDRLKLLGEWVYENFDLLPKEGDSFISEGFLFTVSSMKQHRIFTLTARKITESTEEETVGGK